MPWPIFYEGSILFRDGALAMSLDCCCDEPVFPCNIDCTDVTAMEIIVEGVGDVTCGDCEDLNGTHLLGLTPLGAGACNFVRQQLNVCGLYDWSGLLVIPGPSGLPELVATIADGEYSGNCRDNFNPEDGTITLVVRGTKPLIGQCAMPNTIRARLVRS